MGRAALLWALAACTWGNHYLLTDAQTANLTEHQCLSLNVYHEARGEPLLGQELVAQVTMNRVAHNDYPATVCGVVLQRKQFSWTHDGKIDHPYDEVAYVKAMNVATRFLYHGANAGVSHYNDVLNFHATYVRPRWDSLTPVIHVGYHIFYVRTETLLIDGED